MGFKTFVILKISQSVPRAQVMQVTGHQTEASFRGYLDVVQQQLVETFRKTAWKVTKKGGTPVPRAA
ncbi:hypothetical protein [Hymenobacter actinosclerus]|uniref:Phage integrase family protein n=1 Tax=Hymenobacter actinosclerus TaxID=82805 RepID=A0A1I0INE4_9BACT|nr:hypothetical protein [Hymenobacter actinosclerus]SET98646.1 hypothetical protein SAMN04487998_3407 [Hymenobacter actinosclerus]